MADTRCAMVRDYDPHAEKNWDILKQVKPTLTPHFLRHNYVTLLYEAGVDPLIAVLVYIPAREPSLHGVLAHPSRSESLPFIMKVTRESATICIFRFNKALYTEKYGRHRGDPRSLLRNKRPPIIMSMIC